MTIAYVAYSPMPNQSFVTSSGNSYLSNANNIITGIKSYQDCLDLVSQGCALLNPAPTDQLFTLIGANFNLGSADQQLIPNFNGKYRITKITVTNASISLTTAVGGIYTAVSEGGTAVVANSQAYSALTTALLALDLTLAVPTAVWPAGTPLYLNLSTPQGAAATADVYVFGNVFE